MMRGTGKIYVVDGNRFATAAMRAVFGEEIELWRMITLLANITTPLQELDHPLVGVRYNVNKVTNAERLVNFPKTQCIPV